MKFLFNLLIILTFFLTGREGWAFPQKAPDVTMASKTLGIRPDLLKNIAPLVQQSIANGKYPGAVILASHRGHIIYRGIFGNRQNKSPMRFNTIFDIASLTKVVATTPAIMQLLEQGKLDLDTPVKKYWPEFGNHGKENITIRELLTHTSGLPPDLDSPQKSNASAILKQIAQLKLHHPAGTEYLYSDINFIVLAYLVERISHEPFNVYTKNHILNVLGMKDTSFLPSKSLANRIAPTAQNRLGVVNDPMSYAMNGVSGNAGLFSTASDLGRYAECLLNSGRVPHQKSKYLLSPLTVLKMTTPQFSSPLEGSRGLGWDFDSPYSNRGVLFPIRSFGHTGWTGTSIWIDPTTQTWIIILTNRTYPFVTNDQIAEDRRLIANIIAASIVDTPVQKQINTSQNEIKKLFKAS